MLINRLVKFKLRAFQGSEYDSDRSRINALCREKSRELRFEFPNPLAEDITVDLDAPGFGQVVAWLTELSNQRLLYPDSGYLTLRLVDTPENPYEWFELQSRREARHVNSGTGNKFDLLKCRASAAVPTWKIAQSTPGEYVREDVKAFIESRQCSGAEFIWAEDTGRDQASQWFWLVPHACMGRGLDHPFFDFRKRTQPYVSDSPEWRFGVTSFKKEELKSDAPFRSTLHDQLVALFPPGELNFRTYRQYLRRDVPESDFAFSREIRPAKICFRRRIRDLLVANDVIQEDDCLPILLLDEAPDENETPYSLGKTELPYSMLFSIEELARLRAEKADAYQLSLSHPKPAAAAALKNSLRKLASARDKDKAARLFNPGATRKDLAAAANAHPLPVPKAWCEVMGVCDGFYIADERGFRFRSASSLAKGNWGGWHPETSDAATRYLTISEGDDQAFHSLDLTTLNSQGNCEVHQFAYEDLEYPEKTWPGIAEFVEQCLLDAEEVEKGA